MGYGKPRAPEFLKFLGWFHWAARWPREAVRSRWSNPVSTFTEPGPPSVSNLLGSQHLKMEIACICTCKIFYFQLFLKNLEIWHTQPNSHVATMGRCGVATACSSPALPSPLPVLSDPDCLTPGMCKSVPTGQQHALDILPWLLAFSGCAAWQRVRDFFPKSGFRFSNCRMANML